MIERMLTVIIAAACALAPFNAPAADSTPRYNSVELQAEAQREVQNDLLNAVLYVELNDASPAALANAVNKSVNEALRIAKEYKTVRVRSGNNQSYPLYAKGNVLQGWRSRAEVRLESRDFEAASALIGKLQASMQLGNLSFSVSPEMRRSVENELIAEAIAAFWRAVMKIADQLGVGSGFRVVSHHGPNGGQLVFHFHVHITGRR